ncbi:MAG: LPS export ABC transporter periplasmic protein LptC [Elusimicrobiota bacterium]
MGRYIKFFLSLISCSFLLISCAPKKKMQSIAQDEQEKEIPALRLTDVALQNFDEAGLQWELFSPVAEVFTKKKIIRARKMAAFTYENGTKSTHIKANQAMMSTAPKEDLVPYQTHVGIPLKNNDLFLEGNVVVVSTQNSQVNTDWLYFENAEQIIRSSAPVEVRREDSITRGVGLRATSDLSQVQIFKQTLIIKEKTQ